MKTSVSAAATTTMTIASKTRNMTQYFSGFPEDKDQDHSKHPELEDKSTDATMEGVEGKIFDDCFFSQPGKVFYYLY